MLVFGVPAKEEHMADNTTGGKQEKQEKDEKERDEKFRNDPLSGMAWAAVLIWVGLVLLAENLMPGTLAGREPWPIIFIGAGVIFLLEALIRTQRPEYRRPIGGTVIFAVILIAIGVGDALSWAIIWPVALIVVGGALLIQTFLRRR
jgi:hypothetical protein